MIQKLEEINQNVIKIGKNLIKQFEDDEEITKPIPKSLPKLPVRPKLKFQEADEDSESDESEDLDSEEEEDLDDSDSSEEDSSEENSEEEEDEEIEFEKPRGKPKRK